MRFPFPWAVGEVSSFTSTERGEIERIELDQIDFKRRLLLILLQLQEYRLLQKSNPSGNAGKARKAVPEWNCERKYLSSPVGKGVIQIKKSQKERIRIRIKRRIGFSGNGISQS